ncbi:hypothetical protein JCM11251_006642 [Rhodosporidiobolus azoricus]
MLPARVLKSVQAIASNSRVYLYDLDIHGQLFLSSAKHRTLATCYRDPRFLATFYARLRRNESRSEEAKALRSKGYQFVSLCEGEENYLRTDKNGSPLVFQALEGHDLLHAGVQPFPFDPSSLRLDPATGYLFHPSPIPRRSKTGESPYGPYSLLRSSLVLEHFSDSLELDENGGSYAFAGKRYSIGRLREDDVWRRSG